MNKTNQLVLQEGLNRMLEDGYKEIRARHLNTYSNHDIEVIEKSLVE